MNNVINEIMNTMETSEMNKTYKEIQSLNKKILATRGILSSLNGEPSSEEIKRAKAEIEGIKDMLNKAYEECCKEGANLSRGNDIIANILFDARDCEWSSEEYAEYFSRKNDEALNEWITSDVFWDDKKAAIDIMDKNINEDKLKVLYENHFFSLLYKLIEKYYKLTQCIIEDTIARIEATKELYQIATNAISNESK